MQCYLQTSVRQDSASCREGKKAHAPSEPADLDGVAGDLGVVPLLHDKHLGGGLEGVMRAKTFLMTPRGGIQPLGWQKADGWEKAAG